MVYKQLKKIANSSNIECNMRVDRIQSQSVNVECNRNKSCENIRYIIQKLCLFCSVSQKYVLENDCRNILRHFVYIQLTHLMHSLYKIQSTNINGFK